MPLPTYAIVGVAKGGTSTLSRLLSMHPTVYRPERKEIHFFDRHYRRGLEWYAEQFAPRRREVHVGEATPLYIWDARCRRRIGRDLPDLKCLVILRDPASRAYSHYWHRRRYGGETLSFEDAIAAEPERLAQATDLRDRAHVSYLDRGRYAHQLADLATHVTADQIHVLFLEELVADPRAVGSSALRFLGADPDAMPSWDLPHSNPWYPVTPNELRRMRAAGEALPEASGYPPMDPATKVRLHDHFADDDAALSAWLGRSLPWRP